MERPFSPIVWKGPKKKQKKQKKQNTNTRGTLDCALALQKTLFTKQFTDPWWNQYPRKGLGEKKKKHTQPWLTLCLAASLKRKCVCVWGGENGLKYWSINLWHVFTTLFWYTQVLKHLYSFEPMLQKKMQDTLHFSAISQKSNVYHSSPLN